MTHCNWNICKLLHIFCNLSLIFVIVFANHYFCYYCLLIISSLSLVRTTAAWVEDWSIFTLMLPLQSGESQGNIITISVYQTKNIFCLVRNSITKKSITPLSRNFKRWDWQRWREEEEFFPWTKQGLLSERFFLGKKFLNILWLLNISALGKIPISFNERPQAKNSWPNVQGKLTINQIGWRTQANQKWLILIRPLIVCQAIKEFFFQGRKLKGLVTAINSRVRQWADINQVQDEMHFFQTKKNRRRWIRWILKANSGWER